MIVLLLLSASAKASQGQRPRLQTAPTSHPPGLAALDTDEFCAEVYFPDGAALKKLL